jgi:hypothetical protein
VAIASAAVPGEAGRHQRAGCDRERGGAGRSGSALEVVCEMLEMEEP